MNATIHFGIRVEIDVLDRDRASVLEELARSDSVEPPVLRLDAEHERVIGDAREPVAAEERVPDLRELVEDPHPEEGREDREQDRRFERDRHVRRDRPRRLAGDVPRPVVGVHPPLEEHAAEEAGEAAAEDDQRQDGSLDAHRLVDAVHRERRVAIELGVASVANLLGRVLELTGGVVLREDAVQLALARCDGRRAGIVDRIVGRIVVLGGHDVLYLCSALRPPCA
jgi:hypothetical protein